MKNKITKRTSAAIAITLLLCGAFLTHWAAFAKEAPPVFQGEVSGAIKRVDVKGGYYEAETDSHFRFSAVSPGVVKDLKAAFVKNSRVTVRYIDAPSCSYYMPEVPFRAVQILLIP